MKFEDTVKAIEKVLIKDYRLFGHASTVMIVDVVLELANLDYNPSEPIESFQEKLSFAEAALDRIRAVENEMWKKEYQEEVEPIVSKFEE